MSETPVTVTPSPDEDPPPPPRMRRSVVIGLAIAAVAALVAITVTAVRTADNGTPGSTGSTETQRRNTSDPIAPQSTADAGPTANAASTEAAVRYGWTLQDRDEFDGNTLGPQWGPYSGETTGGVGRFDPANLIVRDGVLTLLGRGLSSAGLAWIKGQLYGRWEVRARTERAVGYGDVLILWPDAEDFPVGGEIDFMEIPKPERNDYNFNLHFGVDNDQDGSHLAGDFTQWHNYAVEWAPDHVAGFVDGQEVFRSTKKNEIPPRPMHLAMQQDIGPYGDDWIPARDASTPAEVRFQIDWIRIYRP